MFGTCPVAFTCFGTVIISNATLFVTASDRIYFKQALSWLWWGQMARTSHTVRSATCSRCSAQGATLRCGTCQSAYYCTAACMAADDIHHRQACSQVRACRIMSFCNEHRQLRVRCVATCIARSVPTPSNDSAKQNISHTKSARS